MLSYFSRHVHEPYECPVAPAFQRDFAKSIPYRLPIHLISIPPHDHIANIDAAIAIRDRLEEVYTTVNVYCMKPNGGFAITNEGIVFIITPRLVVPNSSDPMIEPATCIFLNAP